jgi:hypothetical protein
MNSTFSSQASVLTIDTDLPLDANRTSRIRPQSKKSFWRKLLIYRGWIIFVIVKDGLNGL